MNFEEIEINTAIHTLRHYSNSELNEDHSCYICYPVSPIHSINNAFENFWIWIHYTFRAETYTAYSVTAFNLLRYLVSTTLSGQQSDQLPQVLVRLLTSIRYLRRPFSSEILYNYTLGIAFRTNCFEQRVNIYNSSEAYQEVLD